MALEVFFNPAYYAFNSYALPVFIVGILLLILGTVVLIQEKGSAVSAVFFFLNLSAAAWLLGYGAAYSVQHPLVGLVWIRALHVSVSFIPSLVFLFSQMIVKRRQVFKFLTWLSFTVSTFFGMSCILSDLLVRGARHYFWGYYAMFGPLGVPFLAFFFITLFSSLALLLYEYKKAPKHSAHKYRLKIFLTAFSIAYLASMDFIPNYGVPLYPIGFIPVLGFMLAAAMGIRRFHLVDITPAVASKEIIAMMNDALLVFDSEGCLKLVNRASCRLFNRPERHLLGKSGKELLGNAFFQDLTLELARKEAVLDREWTFMPAEGRPMTLSFSASVKKDELNNTVLYVFVIRDVTQRKMNIEEIQARYAAVVEFSHDGIFSATLDGVITGWNEGAERLYGFSAEEAVGQKLEIIFPPDYREELVRILSQISRGENLDHYETVRVGKNGVRMDVSTTVSPIKNTAGEVIGASSISRDISQRKRAQEEFERTMNIKSDFISTVSHELRTPLFVIQEGLYTVLAGDDGPLNDLQSKHLGLVQKSALRLTRLINDVLDFQKLGSGGMKFNFQPVNLNTLIHEAVESFQPLVQKKGLELVYLPWEPFPWAVCDKDRITQVLVNLLQNAVKFSKKGRIVVSVEASDVFVRINVTDEGPGIPAGDETKLFQSFSQLGSARDRASGGTGLGLAISKSIVQGHGGTIGVESVYGQGSKFYFDLPIEKSSG